MSDSDIARLCQEIYRTHKAAIDLIIEHMPDLRQDLADHLIKLVSSDPSFTKIRYAKSYIDFMPQSWSQIPEFNMGNGWSQSRATLSLEFSNSVDQLNLYLYLGPVEPGNEHIREKLFAYASGRRDIFTACRPRLDKQWTVLYKMPLLNRQDYEDASLDDLVKIITPKWHQFVGDVLPQLDYHLKQVRF